ncbi:MAG: response regulator [Eubacterium sp.]|nr:response regulator [Eubacterium sp.]
MSLLDRFEKVRKRDTADFVGFDDKKIELDKEFNLYTREGQYYVLVVVPDVQERMEFERLVDQTGCFVTSVGSGIECLEQVSSDKFDLIFISRIMPRMDGIQTLRNLKNSPVSKSKDAKVYILLDEKVEEPDIYFENEGFNGIVRKPYDRTIIQNIIIENVPERMLPDDDDLIDDIREYAEDAAVLKACDVRYLEGLKNFKGDVAAYKTEASEFCDIYEERSANLLDAMYTNKNVEYRQQVRDLRERARKLGAIYLGDCFDDHVNMSKDDSLDVAESNWQSLVTEWEKVISGFAKWLEKESVQIGGTEILVRKTNGIKLSERDIKERVSDILADLEQNEVEAAIKKLDKLSDYELEAEKRRKVDQIKKSFDKDKINTAVDILKGMLG